MKRLIVAVILVALGACASPEPKVETIDGVKCMVKRNTMGRVDALDCDWGNDER